MHDFDLVIRNGHLANAAEEMDCDIGIKDGIIVALGKNLAAGKKEIDATGKLVLPGGIDSHCHIDQPTSDGTFMADDFESGSISAAFGGNTTIIPFACQLKGQSVNNAVQDYHQRADNKAVIDYAFHLIISDPTEQALKHDLPDLIEKGYSSYKIYMTYDDLKLSDGEMLSLLDLAKREGAMTMIHAENSDCIDWLTDQLEKAGKTDPIYHAESRPPAVEREATHRAATLAEITDATIMIVHVSGIEAIEQIRDAQSRGVRIHAETCPQYLFLTAEDIGLDGFEGAKLVCSPPPRDKANQDAVWNALENGLFKVFSSDHAPFRYDDPNGKMIHGTDVPFRNIPNGIPGLETRMPLLFSEGVGKGRIDINQFVALTSTNSAKIYGLYPQKGTLAIGSDADIVIWDANKELTINNDDLHHNVDYTPYEGMTIKGAPEITISRGEVICANSELLAATGRGQFLRRKRPLPTKTF